MENKHYFCKTNFEIAQGFYPFVFHYWHIPKNTTLASYKRKFCVKFDQNFLFEDI